MKSSDLDDRSAADDILSEANSGATGRRLVNCGSTTLNTPYKAGLTSLQSGTAVICMSSVNYGSIMYITAGIEKIFLRSKVDGNWGNWESLITDTDIEARSVVSQFTGSANCTVLSAYKSGNMVQLWVNLKNISQGWTEFVLTSKYTIASGTAIPGIVHRSAASDSAAQISCTYNGAKITVLSSVAAGTSAGVVALFILIIK